MFTMLQCYWISILSTLLHLIYFNTRVTNFSIANSLSGPITDFRTAMVLCIRTQVLFLSVSVSRAHVVFLTVLRAEKCLVPRQVKEPLCGETSRVTNIISHIHFGAVEPKPFEHGFSRQFYYQYYLIYHNTHITSCSNLCSAASLTDRYVPFISHLCLCHGTADQSHISKRLASVLVKCIRQKNLNFVTSLALALKS